MKKVRIIIYDDMGIMLDDTEVISSNKEQIQKIAESMLKTTSGAEYSEVWNDKRMKMKFVLTRKGNVKSVNVEHPNWGGRRPNSGLHFKNRPKVYPQRVILRVTEEMYEQLIGMEKKSDFIRAAIQEKMDREYSHQDGATEE